MVFCGILSLTVDNDTRKGDRMPKRKSSYSLSDDARTLLLLLASKLGVSQSAMLEFAIRETAERHKVVLPKADQ